MKLKIGISRCPLACSVKGMGLSEREGITIQLYLGDNRILAEETEIKLNQLDSLTERITIFTQPNYRVKVGKYYNRFNANRDYNKFKKTFPNSIIIPEKIKIQ